MKKKILIFFLIIIVSILIVVGICWYLFRTIGKTNEGNYRINDVVVTSRLEVNENNSEGENITSISQIKFDASQTNTISILVEKQNDAQSMYLDNIYVKQPSTKGNFVISQKNADEHNVDGLDKLELNPVVSDEQYLVELKVDNIEMLKSANVATDLDALTFDGKILKLLNIGISDIQFEIGFNLNIVESTGKVSTCKFKFDMPSQELIDNGTVIDRKDVGKFLFSVK